MTEISEITKKKKLAITGENIDYFSQIDLWELFLTCLNSDCGVHSQYTVICEILPKLLCKIQ